MTTIPNGSRPVESRQEWIWSIIACPECGSPLVAEATDGGLACERSACGFRSSHRGQVYNLLPRSLDQFQHAEHNWRQQHYDRLARSVAQMSPDQYRTFRLLDTITYYSFTSQFAFFRDHFSKQHRLRGRGLEVGGSNGQLSGFVKLFYPETEMVTSDVAPVNVELAEELARLLGFGTDYFVMADAERLPFRPGSFDFLCSSGMLHHLGDMRRALRAGRAALKPGGRWYIVNELSIGALPRLFWNSRLGQKGKWALTTGIRENSYTLSEWRRFFAEQEFKIVDMYFQRDPRYKLLSWPRALYYAAVARLPLALLRAGVPCEINFVLEKQ
ncbi:MAG: class I SAM-dependent methyltransferase [Chloroflexales bacterium]|nr:class I SAM-dependent methyltransferase [Chloroflexales bacterium]